MRKLQSNKSRQQKKGTGDATAEAAGNKLQEKGTEHEPPDINLSLHPSAHNKNKQQQQAGQKNLGSGFGHSPGLKLWGWPYPVVPSLNPGFQLWAVLPLRGAAAPTWGVAPEKGAKRAKNGPKQPRTAPRGPWSGSAILCGRLGRRSTPQWAP